MNRNIIAHNIEKGVSVVNKESTTQTYNSVAPMTPTPSIPSTPTCEVPEIAPQTVNVNIQAPQIQTPVYEHTVSQNQIPSSIGNFDDELPF